MCFYGRKLSHLTLVKFLAFTLVILNQFWHLDGFTMPVKRSIERKQLYMGKGFGTKTIAVKYTGMMRPGVQSPTRKVPVSLMLPEYALDGRVKSNAYSGNRADVKPTPPEDIELMRIAGRYAREVLDAAVRHAKVGVTTDSIDEIVHAASLERNCYPSPLNYSGFPKSCCTSVNEVICHGIPDSYVLQDGDIVNIDITVYYKGVHGDCSETILIGEKVDDKVKDLVHTTYQAWQAAIAICKPGTKYNLIGGVIEDIVRPKGYSSVKEFCGHGINRVFHTYPNVLHYRNTDNLGIMAPGHTFTIEPMINMGKNGYFMWPDKWTATTLDGLPSAQFEHTILITETGADLLTARLPDSPKFFWET